MKINKTLIQSALYWHEDDVSFQKDDFSINKIEQKGSDLIFYLDEHELGFKSSWNIYELGILLKEYLEDYAQKIILKGIWVDLNNLSEDEEYYFNHCSDIYEALEQYNLIMETEQ